MTIKIQGHELFVRQLFDKAALCQKTGQTLMTSFLSPSEQQIAKTVLSKALAEDIELKFEGGYEDAQRKAAVFYDSFSSYQNDWTDLSAGANGVVCLHTDFDAYQKPLRHPDLLGALMHSGLSRDVIGDIICTEKGADLFVKAHVANLLLEAPFQVKRQMLQFSLHDPSQVKAMAAETIRINVSSLRLDCVVAALAHTSRSRAMELIRQGLVKINDVPVEDCQKLCDNDHVSIRRTGRFMLVGVVGTTKKDRLIVEFKKYV